MNRKHCIYNIIILFYIALQQEGSGFEFRFLSAGSLPALPCARVGFLPAVQKQLLVKSISVN